MSKAPTRDECEALFELLRAGWASGDFSALRDRVVGALGQPQLLEQVIGRPVAFEGAEPITDRASLMGVRTSLGGMVGIEVHRDREGVARLELGMLLGNGRDRGTTLAGLAEQARSLASPPASAKPPKKRKKRKWRAAPPAPASSEIPYLGLDRPEVSAAEIASLEASAGAPLPEGYIAYVGRFGESCDSTFLRVHPPERILRERDEWRRRIDTYWFWSASDDGFDQDAACDSYVLADTLSGDEVLWHPARQGRFYVLPRDHEEVIAREMSFEALLSWAASSGDLDGRVSLRFVVPLEGRVQISFDCDAVDPEALTAALTPLGEGVRSALGAEGANLLWPAHGLEVFASAEPYLALTHEPTTDTGFLARVLEVLAREGFERA